MTSAGDQANEQMVDRLIAEGAVWSPRLIFLPFGLRLATALLTRFFTIVANPSDGARFSLASPGARR
jgi:hypothetical protein